MEEKITIENIFDVLKINGIDEKYVNIIKKYKLWLWSDDSLNEFLDVSEAIYWETGFSDIDEYHLRVAMQILLYIREKRA